MRHLIFHASPRTNSRGDKIPDNGFASAFVRVGRRVLVNEAEFLRLVATHESLPAQPPPQRRQAR